MQGIGGMRDFICVTGMILKQMPVGEYDRRIVILTLEKGKVSAFARGVRRQNSRLGAGTCPFCFGRFKLYGGRDAYTLGEAEIQNYFEALRGDYEGAYYGMYFAEVADYYGRENNDERQLLKLLYQSLRALCAPSLPNRLVRAVFEIRSVAVNGEYPGPPQGQTFLDSTLYALAYIADSPIEKLYTFNVTEEVLLELEEISRIYQSRFVDREFKSLEILQTLC